MLKLYVFSNRDGLLVVPVKGQSLDSKRRVFIAGGGLNTMNEVQLNALVELAFRDPAIRKGHRWATFYDGAAYAREVKRPKVLLVHRWA